ncbi:MAG TPA: FAD-binding and (Fe-S)-binding domain-containing protein [Thermoanaerobaculia bacterium]|nr:FAD-binding and (Fe-S)-binding domain-containing protein [Thermoanaerobaculia bacterium]
MTPRRFDPIRFDKPGAAARVNYSDRVQRVNVDAAALASALRREVRGEVRFDNGSRALYATDASNYRQVPIGVVLPRDANDAIAAVALARKYGAPILARGGGTSLAGQCCNVAVVLDFSKYMHDIVELNPSEKYAWVQPGIVLDDLRTAAEQHRLTFGPDPATHTRCTIGGMIGNNSCGVHALMAGKTVDNIEALKVLLYDGTQMTVSATSDDEIERIIARGGREGEIFAGLKKIRDTYGDEIRRRYPKIPRRVSGYNLDSLLPDDGFHVAKALVGSESTCVVVLEAKCRLVDSPPSRVLAVLGYEDIYIAADHVPRLLEFEPIGLEGVDDRLAEDMKAKHLHVKNLELLPEGKGWLLVEFGGESIQDAEWKAQRMIDALKKEKPAPSAKLYTDPAVTRKIWQIRESGLGATAFVPGRPMTWEGWEDSAVDPKHLGKYLRELRALMNKFGYNGDLYGHFGQACVHTRNNFDLESAPGIAKYRAYIDEAADLCIKYNGSLSGEHGDGQSRAELLPKMFGERLVGAFREFKALWDPEWKMNPGKVVTPYHPTENLRLGADFQQWAPQTHFQFPEDQGRMERAVMRCVGVGECRRFDHGVMCPSYMVTREEEHSTRGRARLLFEMFEGEVIPNDWRNEAVKDALDLCLACKGCKGECPVNVDMATFKAEFLSHYYEGRLRPVTAYSMGLIYWWSRAAAAAPQVANTIMALPFVKRLAGVAPERRMPVYARETFVDRFRKRPQSGEPHRRVLLWPDTFNNHFHPETAMAAVEVLENAGYHVTIPRRPLCCGRPLYDFGFLKTAKRLLEETMDALQPELEEGIPIIGLEPSCVSVFRDELTGLYPAHPAAKRLKESTMTLSEFLVRENVPLPSMKAKALMQAHCHHRAIMKINAEEEVLKKIGLDLETPDAGCCGMAGAFGFEREHYEISMRVGERLILPKVREASLDTIIVADGFSCREQIAQSTPRRALHLAQVLQMALRKERGLAPAPIDDTPPPDLKKTLWTVAGIAGGAALFAGGLWLLRNRRKRLRTTPSSATRDRSR